MKTSNKTNSRLFVITAAIVVMSLVSTNISAQKAFNDNSLAYIGRNLLSNSKKEITNAVIKTNEVYSDWTEETLEDWMKNPADWKENNSSEFTEEVDFEEQEMVLEDWMMKTNWSENSLMEEELEIEDWMNNPDEWNTVK